MSVVKCVKKIKIGSFNTWNNVINRRGITSNIEVLSQVIKEENFDVVGTQELTLKYCNNIQKKLSNYNFYGSYRFGDFIFKRFSFNENNSIITNKKVLFHKTIHLPFMPVSLRELKRAINIKRWSLLPRIATVVVIEINDNHICMINTHLDYKINSIKKRQLSFLEKLIKEYIKDYPVVLTGDFNLDVDDEIFNDFVFALGKLGMMRVDISESTWNYRGKNKKTLDHIFVPKTWKVLNCGVIKDDMMNDISDHRMIFAECEVK